MKISDPCPSFGFDVSLDKTFAHIDLRCRKMTSSLMQDDFKEFCNEDVFLIKYEQAYIIKSIF